MRKSRQTNARRKPFSDGEITLILNAVKNNTFSKSKSYPHSQYHDFLFFLFHTGARNGEAIGLKVGDVRFDTDEIVIWRSFSRTRKGSNVAARQLKSTKMDNERFIPMEGSAALRQMLQGRCEGKSKEEFVFATKRGNPVDDRMFQKRVFKPLLKELGITERDLYACRHTFATRAVRSGMLPHQVAYVMGDAVDTILKNYFHNNAKPSSIPSLEIAPLRVVA